MRDEDKWRLSDESIKDPASRYSLPPIGQPALQEWRVSAPSYRTVLRNKFWDPGWLCPWRSSQGTFDEDMKKWYWQFMSTNPDGTQPATTPFDDGDLYDALFEGIGYGTDFYQDLARQARGPILDLACGTGRILLPCAEAGLDIEGVDLFPAMLRRLEHKAKLKGLSPRLHQADMRQFHLDRSFALIMIPFNSFVHNLTADAQIESLKCCRDHLLPGGSLVFDTFFPGLEVIAQPDKSRVLELEKKHPWSGCLLRLYDTRSFNRVEQIQQSFNEVEELNDQGQMVATHSSATSIRWIYRNETELLLRLAGFMRWEIFGDFDRRPLVHETDAMIVQAWREGKA